MRIKKSSYIITLIVLSIIGAGQLALLVAGIVPAEPAIAIVILVSVLMLFFYSMYQEAK